MAKGFVGVFVSLIIAVAAMGVTMWDLHQRSHQIVMDSDHLKALIDQQRNSYLGSFSYHNTC